MFERDSEARAFGFTAVENLFLTDYMPSAKGEYVKVYLWGLYASQNPDKDYGVAEMAKELEMAQAEVESALRYWERRALVSLISTEPPVYRFYSPLQRQQKGQLTTREDDAYVDFAESVYAAFGDKRKVKPTEIARAWEWVQDVGLKPEAVLMLINHCISSMRSQFSFKKAEMLAVCMKDQGVVTAEDAEAFLRNDQATHDGAQEVLRQLGRRGRLPSEPELSLYQKWRAEWGFSHDAILRACKETAKGEPTFAYLDGILNGIRKRGDARTEKELSAQLTREQDVSGKAMEIMDKMGIHPAKTMAVNFYTVWRKSFPHEVLLLAAGECARAGGKVEGMEMLLAVWQKKGLVTEEAVRDYLSRFRAANADLKILFEECGQNGKPTASDRALYEKWTGFGMKMDLMTLAARQSKVAQGSKIAYLDKVLTTWHDAGITEISQAEARKAPLKAASGASQEKEKTVSAQRYSQRSYSEEELAGASGDLMEEARKLNG